MHSLFFTIARGIDGAEGVTPRKLFSESIMEYVENHFAEDISLSSVANEFSLSPEYMSRLFKKECGIGFAEYLTVTRLQAAKELMIKENKSVSEAAFLCGYSDSNYFSTSFKKIFGVSPKKLLSQNK